MVKTVDSPRKIELLAPARDVQTAVCAIDHGADAVYIGPSAFGARASASNDTADIARLCEYAHQFRARVYATVNTIVMESELKSVERLIRSLYNAGVDALIVQDMGILRMDIPLIELHASTQCDTRTPEKAKFLEEAGFSQIVLARELTLKQIGEVCDIVKVPVEVFVHGALCVCYSGRCHASWAACGRSANRGCCAQLCRLPYVLSEADGRPVSAARHYLSLRDFNASSLLSELLRVGVSSFKIEGRLKDPGYVKNVTAYYRTLIDREIDKYPELYKRASSGSTKINFDPNPYKSFNRGFTEYFLSNRQPKSIASLLTPKSMGEPIDSPAELRAGDGISYFSSKGEYVGVRINKVVDGKPVPAKGIKIPAKTPIYRTLDVDHEKLMSRSDTSSRKIGVDIALYENRAIISDERGCRVVLPMPGHEQTANKPMEPKRFFEKLGGTIYVLNNFENHLSAETFIPASVLTDLRRRLVAALDENASCVYSRPLRRNENEHYPYPQTALTYADNVSNHLAEEFYHSHGVKSIESALETSSRDNKKVASGTVVMTTRHCILRELGMCKRAAKSTGRPPLSEPLTLTNTGGVSFRLRFDCKSCEMQLLWHPK